MHIRLPTQTVVSGMPIACNPVYSFMNPLSPFLCYHFLVGTALASSQYKGLLTSPLTCFGLFEGWLFWPLTLFTWLLIAIFFSPWCSSLCSFSSRILNYIGHANCVVNNQMELISSSVFVTPSSHLLKNSERFGYCRWQWGILCSGLITRWISCILDFVMAAQSMWEEVNALQNQIKTVDGCMTRRVHTCLSSHMFAGRCVR